MILPFQKALLATLLSASFFCCKNESNKITQSSPSSTDSVFQVPQKSQAEIEKEATQNLLSAEYNRFLTETQELVEASQFKKALEYEAPMLAFFEKNQAFEHEVDPYKKGFSVLKNHLLTIDSLENVQKTVDSLAFFKALALSSICSTPWMVHEGTCEPCNSSLSTNALQAFLKKYPASPLCDNAEWALNGVGSLYYDEAGDMGIEGLRKIRSNFLKKYPDTDVLPDVEFDFWFAQNEFLYELSEAEKSRLKKEGSSLLKKYPNYSRATEVREILTSVQF